MNHNNLISDLNKGILEIQYNELNLPVRIVKDQNNRIEYLYDALGNKKRQIEYRLEGLKIKMTTTDFIGNFVYIDGKPAWNTFDEGRVVYTSAGTCFAENYIKDHLGNVRVAYGNDGSGSLIRQVNAYYPFGMTISSLSGEPSNLRTSENEYQYNGKMFQDELGLNWYDYGARFYDPVVGRWWSVDPLAEQYLSYSNCVYVLNNPINFIDTDGRKVKFAKGVSKEFKKAFAAAVKHLNKNKASSNLAKLQASKSTYYIAEGENRGSYKQSTKTITWDPNMGLITNNGVLLSPTTILNHEFDHALQHDKNPRQLTEDLNTENTDYDNEEEKRVITGSEQETAKNLGEIEEDEVTRTDHKGYPYETQGPTTTESNQPVTVTATRNKEEEGQSK